MRSLISIATVLVFAAIVSAAEKAPVVTAPPAGGQETVQQVQGTETPMAPMANAAHEKRMFQGHEFDYGCSMMQPGNCGPACMAKEYRGMGGLPFMNHHAFIVHAFVKMLFLSIVIINILLTVIVSLDMAHSGRFNGLWVPVILLAGLPGSVIYALFRIGDKIQAKING